MIETLLFIGMIVAVFAVVEWASLSWQKRERLEFDERLEMDNGSRFWQGVVVALPISAVFWLTIWWLVVGW